ncbi:RHS repeat domain-containing protein [Flavobacterium sp. T12S277]|uniref:RHS repeat protein n=1 Tax=Flavobacterium sp. T12S277 TaxID=3402752 RepID=UPI003AE47BB6
MLKSILLRVFFFSVLVTSSLLAQATKDLPNYFPVSPNAASFAKQGLFPVDYSTGKIDISIPLYTIKTKELKVPIALSYNSAGIQLDELASWVGLGWNLNAGGAVVRNVKGIVDNGTPVPDLQNLTFTAENYNLLYKQYNPYRVGEVDTAYDEFIVNAPGLSGTFYFVNNKAIFRDLQNTIVKTSETNNQLFSKTHTLEITKADGTVYRFGKALDGYDATETIRNNSGTYRPDYNLTWYLTEIIPPNDSSTNGVISFKYQQLQENTLDYPVVIGEQLADNRVPNYLLALQSVFPNPTISNKLFLTAINFNNGSVEFTASRNRLDLADDLKLDKISVFSIKGSTKTVVQEYGFAYDYYLRSGGNTTSQPPTLSDNVPYSYTSARNIASRNKSLKLTQLTNNVLNTKHSFEYEGTTLPLRGTTKKDYWGYINDNSGNLSPPTYIKRLVYSEPASPDTYVGNGNRSSNENLMKSGILQRINYPEGGYSVFEFESNRYNEFVTTPTITYRSETARAYGSGCTYDSGPSSQIKTFTPSSTYIGGSGKITYGFTNATQEHGPNTKVTYDSNTYFRPAPVGSGYPSGGGSMVVNFGSGTHTLGAYEYRTGNVGASGCPITYITASWEENSGSVTTLVPKFIGGLRIKSIKSYDGKNINPVAAKQYSYEQENPLIKEGNGSFVRYVFDGINTTGASLPIFSTTSLFDNNTGGSPAISYGKIIETENSGLNNVPNGKTEYYYENISSERMLDNDVSSSPVFFKSPFFNADGTTNPNAFHIGSNLSYFSFVFFKNELWNQGSLLRTAVYKTGDTPNTFKIIKSTVNKYAVLKKTTLPYNIVLNNFSEADQRFPGDYPQSFALPYNQGSDYHSYLFYYGISKTSQGKKVLTQTTETDYDINEVPTTEKITIYGYENPAHYEVTKTEITNSKDEILRTQLSYPQDLIATGQTAEMQKLVAQNKIERPIKTETFLNNVQTSESITKYEQSLTTGNALLPKEIHSSKGVVETFPFNAANRKINFSLYDSDVLNGVTVGNGNVLEYALENGTPVSIIWGYNKSQPIAKIENASYSLVAAFVANLQNLSNTGTEAALISALNALRTSLPNCMITTYTYLPLVGVSTITDPKGDTIIYTYDAAGRLQFVKDAKGNLLSENQYHYKN